MRVRHLTPGDYRAMPWKNGGGTTHEIAVAPAGAGADSFLWRLSIAEVATSGPFSAFPGIDRTLTVLEGDGMKLDFAEGGDLVIDVPWRPAAFDGGRSCFGRLIGRPVLDFNVMSRRGQAAHRVRAEKLDDEELSELLENEVTALLVLRGHVTGHVGGTAHRIGPRETLLVERAPDERATWELIAGPETTALIVEIDLTPAR